MKLEVGMYVRTDLGEIAKIIKVKEHTDKLDGHKYKELIDDNKLKYGIYDDLANSHVTKASHNIIDLIEVGDYVNGAKVNNIDIEDGQRYLMLDLDNCLHNTDMISSSDEIKSIVTKKQFESMQYRIGD